VVDANSAYTLNDWPLLKQLEGFYLMMIETAARLGRSLQSRRAAEKAGHPDLPLMNAFTRKSTRAPPSSWAPAKFMNIKLGRVGGHTVARRIHISASATVFPSGAAGCSNPASGRAHNIALSTLPNFTLAGDVAASKRYWEEDIILPEVTVSAQGTIRVPTSPGIGFEPRLERIDKLTVRKERLA